MQSERVSQAKTEKIIIKIKYADLNSSEMELFFVPRKTQAKPQSIKDMATF